MSISTVARIPLAEAVSEFHDYLTNECDQPEMVADFPPAFVMQEMLYVAKVAANRPHVNVHEYLERTRNIFKSYDKNVAEKAEDIADEMYLIIRNELPEILAKERNIYQVELENTALCVRLLVSGEALSYGIDAQPLIDLVV